MTSDQLQEELGTLLGRCVGVIRDLEAENAELKAGREWRSLTDEEISRILGRGDVAERTEKGAWAVLPYGLARAIEQKLKEKNHD